MSNVSTSSVSSTATFADLVNALNMKPNVVRKYISPSCTVNSEAVQRVKAKAQEIGYVPGTRKRKKWIRPANKVFGTREAETKAMEKLRSEGYSNADIALKCGVSHLTVTHRIGRQPADMTAANRKLAGKIASAKTQLRKRYRREQQVREYNEQVEAFNAAAAQLAEQYKQLKKMKSVISKAAKTTSLDMSPLHKLH